MTADRSRHWTLVRYTLFQIPDLILLGLALAAAVHWWGLSLLAALAIGAAWVAKDVVMYPVMRIAYQSDDPGASDRLTGAVAEVCRTLEPEGWVVLGGERWAARLAEGSPAVAVGARVRVLEVRGLALVVEPVAASED